MARTNIPVQTVGRDVLTNLGTLAAPAGGGTAIDQANGHIISPKRTHKLILVIYNSAAGAHVVTIQKGVYPPAESAGQGTITLNMATVTFSIATGLSGARFAQADGSIWLDTDAGTTGTIWAYQMPA